MLNHQIHCQYFSQEDLLASGCLDIRMAMQATEDALLAFNRGDVLFPDKIVQIFNDETQERINCLPATFTDKKVCGVKWVSVFPPNPVMHGIQNLSAVIILSEIEHGFPIAFMEGTLCSNMRVGTMGAIAAKYLARPDSHSIGIIGAGEQAKMHLIAMKTAVPSLRECRGGVPVCRRRGTVPAGDVADLTRHEPGRHGDQPGSSGRRRRHSGHRDERARTVARGGVDEARRLLQPCRRLGGRVRRGIELRQDCL